MSYLIASALVAAAVASGHSTDKDIFGFPSVPQVEWIASNHPRPVPRLNAFSWFCFKTPTEACLQRQWMGLLRGAGEVPLGIPSSGATYRMLWFRSFHSPLIMRLDLHGRDAELVALWLNPKDGRDAHWTRMTAQVSEGELNPFYDALLHRPLQAMTPELYQELACSDGAEWTFEVARPEGYHYARRTCGLDENLAPLGLALIALGRSKWPNEAWDPVY